MTLVTDECSRLRMLLLHPFTCGFHCCSHHITRQRRQLTENLGLEAPCRCVLKQAALHADWRGMAKRLGPSRHEFITGEVADRSDLLLRFRVGPHDDQPAFDAVSMR